VVCMKVDRTLRKIFNTEPEGVMPNLWFGGVCVCVNEYIKILGVKNCKNAALDGHSVLRRRGLSSHLWWWIHHQ
jgi:hypothetical protein